MNTKMPRYFLGLDEKPAYQDGNYYFEGDPIRGVRIKVDGKQRFVPCDKYIVLDTEEYEKGIRKEFWDILKESLCSMGLREFKECYADESRPYLIPTGTDLFYKLTPEEIVNKFKAWKEKNEADEAAKKQEAEKKICHDVMDEMLRISQPVKDMGWCVKVQFYNPEEYGGNMF